MSENGWESQLDLWKELINIGGGNAATSIAKMMQTRVHMAVPCLEKMTYSEIFATIMPEDQLIQAVLIQVSGEIEGLFLFILEAKDSTGLVSRLLDHSVDDAELSGSALCEFVNILVNSYLNAVAVFSESSFHASVPILVEDLFGALLSSAYLEEEQFEEEIMLIKNEFLLNGDKMESSLYFVPKVGILEKFSKQMNSR